MINPDLTYYGLFLSNISSEQYENRPSTMPPEVTITLKSTASGQVVLTDRFMSDMEVMNKVRLSMDPAVQAAYEQMLTVMALTNGRVYDAGSGNTTTKK